MAPRGNDGSLNAHSTCTLIMTFLQFKGNRPQVLGVKDGKFLAPVNANPNNVSSQADPSDKKHYIAPLVYTGSSKDAIQEMKGIIKDLMSTEVIECTDSYLYAEFTSRIFGFCDDVEFYAGQNGILDVRSASRLGKSDLGANRNRIESIRQMWKQGQAEQSRSK